METPQRPRQSATEVRNKYGTTAAILLVWVIWCIRDGWFVSGYEHIGFSRFMAYVSTPVLIFCIVMTVSAARAANRQQQNPPQLPPDSPPPA